VRYIGRGPYATIFDTDEKVSLVLDIMAQVRLPLPVLRSVSYFKVREPYTYRHTLMVCALSALMARDLVASSEERLQEAVAGPVHDLGKVCVPLSILRKSHPLTRTERGILEHHASAGYVLLSMYLGDPNCFEARVARDHHERRDGSGYPSRVRLKDRMVEIIAAADVYDALISPRPYRPAGYDNRTALEELTDLAVQGKLNPEVVRTLIAHNRRHKTPSVDCVISEERRGTPPARNLYGIIANEENGAPPGRGQ
jgi:HD-GYP domain-containing protein (c-di-GMP phosphodiesterase class II)